MSWKKEERQSYNAIQLDEGSQHDEERSPEVFLLFNEAECQEESRTNDNVELLLVNLFVISRKSAAEPLWVQNGTDVDAIFLGQRSESFVCGEWACDAHAKKGYAKSDAQDGMLYFHFFVLVFSLNRLHPYIK